MKWMTSRSRLVTYRKTLESGSVYVKSLSNIIQSHQLSFHLLIPTFVSGDNDSIEIT